MYFQLRKHSCVMPPNMQENKKQKEERNELLIEIRQVIDQDISLNGKEEASQKLRRCWETHVSMWGHGIVCRWIPHLAVGYVEGWVLYVAVLDRNRTVQQYISRWCDFGGEWEFDKC